MANKISLQNPAKMIQCTKKVGYMHINNISKEMSVRTLFALVALSIIMTAGFIIFYLKTTINNPSIMDFFSCYIDTFKILQSESTDEPLIAWGIMVIFPLAIYCLTIVSMVSRYKAIKEYKKTLNLKSVDFLQDRVNFNFNKPQYNFACGYSEINRLELVLNTTLVTNKYGSYPALAQVILNFTVLNNKNFTLKNTPIRPMNLIYGVIDYGKLTQKFSYKFEGAGEVTDIKEKIRDYINSGCKQILGTNSENNFKLLSIIFFGTGLFFLLSFKDILNDMFPLIAIVPFIAISFIFDIILLIDKWNESKFRKF